MKKTYSVVIPSYKRHFETVKNAVDSVLAQTYLPCEIIIVDDNVVDSPYSSELEKGFQNVSLCRICRTNNQPGGACAARNLGIANAKGEYVAFLDDDDTWEPTKSEKQLKKFEDGVGMVYCLGTRIDMNVEPYEIRDYYTSEYFKENVTFKDLLEFDLIGSTSQAMVRKTCFNVCGGFDEKLPARQDYEMWLRISKKYQIKGVQEKLFNHIMHGEEQISKSSKRSLNGYIRVYKLYREDYKTNSVAKETMLQWIVKAAREVNMLYYIYYRTLLQLHRLKNRK